MRCRGHVGSKTSCLVLCLFLLSSTNLFTGFASGSDLQRGFHPITIQDADGQEVNLYKESYALLIGVSNYSEYVVDFDELIAFN